MQGRIGMSNESKFKVWGFRALGFGESRDLGVGGFRT